MEQLCENPENLRQGVQAKHQAIPHQSYDSIHGSELAIHLPVEQYQLLKRPFLRANHCEHKRWPRFDW